MRSSEENQAINLLLAIGAMTIVGLLLVAYMVNETDQLLNRFNEQVYSK